MDFVQLLSSGGHLYLDYLPDCETLREHGNRTRKIIEESKIGVGSEEDKYQSYINAIDMYNGCLPKIFSKFELPYSNFEVIKEIELIGLGYLATCSSKSFALKQTAYKKRLKAIEKTSQKLIDLLEPDTELLAIIMSFIHTESLKLRDEFETIDDITDPEEVLAETMIFRLTNIKSELPYFANIEKLFSDSSLGDWLQYGRSGPKTNTALINWVGGMIEIWKYRFGRKLSYSNDPLSGREKFLQFAECCFEKIHPTLTANQPEAIRNAYEKLRNEEQID